MDWKPFGILQLIQIKQNKQFGGVLNFWDGINEIIIKNEKNDIKNVDSQKRFIKKL
jgi:hypothetical protein